MSDNRLNLDGPVLLLGRGGSGQRLLSEVALSLGVFLGNDLNVSGDSLEWLDTLYPLSIECAGQQSRLDSPTDDAWRARLRGRARQILDAAAYTGDVPWGWKLPESVLALGPILNAFPQTRVVHLVRHPLTSALRRTHMTSRVDNPVGQSALPAAYRALGLDADDAADDEPYVHNAVSWAFQVGRVLNILDARDAPQLAMQVRYEMLCRDPERARSSLASFLDIQKPASPIHIAIDPDRMNRVTALDGRTERVWSICGAIATRLGYRYEDPQALAA